MYQYVVPVVPCTMSGVASCTMPLACLVGIAMYLPYMNRILQSRYHALWDGFQTRFPPNHEGQTQQLGWLLEYFVEESAYTNCSPYTHTPSSLSGYSIVPPVFSFDVSNLKACSVTTDRRQQFSEHEPQNNIRRWVFS